MTATDALPICDCHMHVFGDPATYPGASNRTYSPSPKPLVEYGGIADALGIRRIVIVQPSAYGADNRCTLDALASRPDSARAVVVLDEAVPDSQLADWDTLGVRGVRLNLMSPRITDAAAAEAALRRVAGRLQGLGWHLQIYADLELVRLLAPLASRLPVPLVFDHMGGVRAESGLSAPGFALLLALLRDGACWVKLSGADIATWETQDFAAAAPYAEALVAANPRRLVWGTDWPHLVHFAGAQGDAAPAAAFRPVSERALLDSLTRWAGDEATARAILVDNPARLYRF
ncbi:MAG TPA: amidohydrolase family protein [Falsiroseomonas sp.]|jgi:predicted TIM-barrel fold metal-dependent hydrolase|nr:amidohydrolase family protein [Falsiroseomonas sp.]